MQRLHRFIAWADAHREYWLDCVRIYLGLGLLARGLLLITNTSTGYFVDLLQRSGQSWITSGILLHYVMVAHFAGGLMLTIGFLTRIAALVQIPILFGAVFVVHRQDGLFALGQSLEFSALVLFLLCVFVVAGAGKLSLDHVTFRPRRTPQEPPASALPTT
jgi:putative oxidoreductase